MQGADKGWIEIDGTPIIQLLIKQLQHTCPRIFISANRNLNHYAALNYPVLQDESNDYPGPLAGILAGLKACQTDDLLVVPCDGPKLPEKLFENLQQARLRSGAPIAIANDGQRLQPLYALISCKRADALQRYLHSGQRKVTDWFSGEHAAVADFSTQQDAFINLNTQTDVENYQTKTCC